MKHFIIASVLAAALVAPVSAGTLDTAKDAISDADAFMADMLDNETLNYMFSLGWLVDLGAWFDGIGGVPADAPNSRDNRH